MPRDSRGRWLPGETANTAGLGRKPWPDELKGVAKLSPAVVECMIAKFAAMQLEDFANFVAEKKGTMLEIMIASVMHKGVVKGDPLYLDFLFNRSIGKMKDGDEQKAAVEKAADEIAGSVPVDTVVAYLRDRKRA